MDVIPGYDRLQRHEVLRGSGVSEWDALPPEIQARLITTATGFRTIRDTLGRGVRVVSGYRSPEANKACGGAAKSQHVQGKALDLALVGRTEALLQREMRGMYWLIDAMQRDGRLPPGGLAIYAGKEPKDPRRPRKKRKRNQPWVDFLHWDWRGYLARWNGSQRILLLGR